MLGVISSIVSSIALFSDVNISNSFNPAVYAAFVLIIPALFITIAERIKFSNVIKEFQNGNKKAILVTSLCWGLTVLVQLIAYQLGDVTSVAPLCALTVIGNVIVGYLFLKERNNLAKKLIAAIIIIISVILING